MKSCMGSKVWRKGLGEFPPTEPAAHGPQHTDEGGYVNGVQAQPWPLPVLQRSLQFEIDDSCPSMSGCCGEDCSYKILSCRTKFGDSQHAHAEPQRLKVLGFSIPWEQLITKAKEELAHEITALASSEMAPETPVFPDEHSSQTRNRFREQKVSSSKRLPRR
ncbi:N-alpha-acetyltransferase 40-like [Macaca nemestrina]|uniref:N-alpha-acetyltransferase 40-like n=1 Tax=Macaca nemestrina TaxID=9545 RepID=UPI0039B834BE